MAYTETTNTSWFSRLGSSFSGMGIGLLLFIAGTVMLWWNEGDFVATRDALNEAQGVAVKVDDISKVDSSLNGKLIHASGRADTQDVLKDPVFQVGERAIAIRTKVEYYQWTEQSKEETRKKLGGGEETVTVYTYSEDWVSSPVNSSEFKDPAARERHANTVWVQVEDNTIRANNVSFGAYKLPDFLIQSISRFEPMNVELDPAVRENIKMQLQNARSPVNTGYSGTYGNNQGSATWRPPADVFSSGNTIYIGPSSTLPTVGDVRITFEKVLPTDVSIIAKVNGNTFEPYYSSNGETVSKLSLGNVTMENMFGQAHSSNSTMTWLFRAGGAILIIFALKLLFAPLTVIADVIPLLGSIVSAGTGIVCTLLGGAWSLIVISIAWLAFRPLIGAAMLGIAAILIVLLFLKGRKKKASETPSA